MNHGRAPNYRLKVEHQIRVGQDALTLPQGAWLRPVEFLYLPHHLRNASEYIWMDQEKNVACYTKYGFHIIPRDKLEAA